MADDSDYTDEGSLSSSEHDSRDGDSVISAEDVRAPMSENSTRASTPATTRAVFPSAFVNRVAPPPPPAPSSPVPESLASDDLGLDAQLPSDDEEWDGEEREEATPQPTFTVFTASAHRTQANQDPAAVGVPLPDGDSFDEGEYGPEGQRECCPEDVGAEQADTSSGRPKRAPIQFKSEPPALAEARRQTTITDNGKFVRQHKMVFRNWKYNAHLQPRQEEPEEEEEESYAGMEFTNSGYQANSYAPRYPPRRTFRPYNYEYRREREYDTIAYPYVDILDADDAAQHLRDTATFEETVGKGFLNQNQWALPESVIWKMLGRHAEYVNLGFMCPHFHEFDHPQFTSKELAAEKYRVALVYELVCENGLMHVEDLWKVYEGRNKQEEHPFDTFDHFYRFLRERSHVFGMDKHRNVYNQNLLITVAAIRYVHALKHGTAVENAPGLFKEARGKLFYRAFLGFMSKDDLSFDRFFEHFPSLFTFTDVWSLNPDALSIPAAFDPNCLPKRHLAQMWIDKSQHFTGIGIIISNNILGLKLESEETLRRDMSYLISVPNNVLRDKNRELYEVGAKVAYTGHRIYNGDRASVMATHVELLTENPAHDGTTDCWTFDDEGDEDSGPAVVETVCKEVRQLDEIEKLACDEKRRNTVLLGPMEDAPADLTELWSYVDDLFEEGFDFFIDYIGKRPWLFIPCQVDGKFFVAARPSEAKWAMIEFLTELSGADRGDEGRSWLMEEAVKLCALKNESLDEEDRFTMEDLDQVLFVRKGLRVEGSVKKIARRVRPLVRWDREHKLLMQL